MFTGIVEELGRVQRRQGGRLTIGASVVLEGLGLGDSVAHDGCCLTVVAIDASAGVYDVEMVAETLARTTLGRLAPGDVVNLERPVAAGGRLGGHLVQGHVDGVAEVVAPAPELTVAVPEQLCRYVVAKGSIALDGCSLTVASVDRSLVSVAVIPHTAEVTTLGRRGVGEGVNVEVDLVAKYVEKLLEGRV